MRAKLLKDDPNLADTTFCNATDDNEGEIYSDYRYSMKSYQFNILPELIHSPSFNEINVPIITDFISAFQKPKKNPKLTYFEVFIFRFLKLL